MQARRVLFVSQDMPWPPQSGGVIRTHRMLSGLARRFDVTVVASGADRPNAAAGRAALESLGCEVVLVPDVKRPGRFGVARSALLGLVRGESLVLRHNHNPHLERAVRERIEGVDAVQLNQLDTVEYVAGFERSCAVVLDTQNVLHEYYARRAELEPRALTRLACRREAKLLRAYELEAFRRVACTVVCSEAERQSLLRLDPALAVEVVPNGVDIDAVPPPPFEPSGAGYDIVFVGDMRYGPNVDGVLWFAEEALPLVLEREPRARFVVVGKEPPKKLVELARLRPEIVVTGFVEDVREPVLRARVAVVPLRYGSGTRLKVLEAFALQRPLVATRLGAEGIGAVHERHVLLADEPRTLADGVTRLFAEPAFAAELVQAARELVTERYAWPALADTMADVLEQVSDGRQRCGAATRNNS